MWSRVYAVQLFIEHVCPRDVPVEKLSTKNVLPLWKVSSVFCIVLTNVQSYYYFQTCFSYKFIYYINSNIGNSYIFRHVAAMNNSQLVRQITIKSGMFPVLCRYYLN